MSALGTELKLIISVDEIDGMSMSDYEFSCTFFTYKNRTVVVSKSEMTKVDNGHYIATLDTLKVGAGNLKMKFEAEIPDSDFSDGFRREVELVDLGIPIIAV